MRRLYDADLSRPLYVHRPGQCRILEAEWVHLLFCLSRADPSEVGFGLSHGSAGPTMNNTSPIADTTTAKDCEADTSAFAIEVFTPDGTSTLPIGPGRSYTIGRRPSSDLVLDYPGIALDHAVIFGGNPPEIIDLGSPDGTSLNARMLPPGVRVELQDDNLIFLSGIRIVARQARVSLSVPRYRNPSAVASCSGAPEERLRGPVESDSIVIRNAKMQNLYALVKHIATSDVSVLILGETGVGKEVIARAVHEHSPRRANRLITLNCAAIPENLVESELFGYERGAFSGASTAKPGLFEAASASTLFLDEIGELSRNVQAKLLRALETGEVLRLGTVRPVRVDVRIVAATNRDIQAEIANGLFRADLYYRLNGVSVTIPPLRERPDDIPALAYFFARRFARDQAPRFTDDAIATLQAFPWPGNVRELRCVVERAVLLAQGAVIDANRLLLEMPAPAIDFAPRSPVSTLFTGSVPIPQSAADNADPFSPQERPTGVVAAEFKAELARREERRIREALERAGGNQTDAAKLLGMSRRTLINRLERYSIARPRKRREGTTGS